MDMNPSPLTVGVSQLVEHSLIEVVREHCLALHLYNELQVEILRVDEGSIQHGQQRLNTLEGEGFTAVPRLPLVQHGIRQATSLHI